MKRILSIAAISLIILVATGTVFSQDDVAGAADPPSRVARLSFLSGDVSFQPNGVDDWVTATMNRPLTTSDRLWTGRGSRAELQTDNATMRLNGETSFTLANLSDTQTQIQIADGVMNVTLRQLEPNEVFEIDTPNFTVNLLRSGEYRIQVDNANNISWITVRSGSAEATGGPQAVTIQPGQQAKFSGGDDGTYDVSAAAGPDGFDQWCRGRDNRESNAQSAQYVSRGVIGYEDLDEYGTWRTYEDYGVVWVPRVATVGWAPYHYGHWAWIYPWGWTWVDDAPWGFAPFHYGRWIHAGFGWAWVPGPVYVRPVYAPALVAWCGGSGWSVGVSFGAGIGWFPLGPREAYIPWYWGSRRYFSRVNISNTRIVNVNNYYNNYYYPHWHDRDGHGGHGQAWNDHRQDRDDFRHTAQIDYANRHAPNGVTFVDRNSFVNGRPISKTAMNIPADRMRNAPVLTGMDLKPDRQSLLGGRNETRVRPPQNGDDRNFVSRGVPPKRLSFEKQASTFYVPRPPQAGMAKNAMSVGGYESHAKIPEIQGNPGTPRNTMARPNWTVPRPPNEQQVNRNTSVRERTYNPPRTEVGERRSEINGVTPRTNSQSVERERVFVDRGRTESPQTYHSPQEHSVQHSVEVHQRGVSAPVSDNRRVYSNQQHVERVPASRQNIRVEHSVSRDSGGHNQRGGASGTQGRHF